jgi:hypothetical protein
MESKSKYEKYTETMQTAFSIFASLNYEKDLNKMHAGIQDPATLFRVYRDMVKKFKKTEGCHEPTIMAKVMLAFPHMNKLTCNQEEIVQAMVEVDSILLTYRLLRVFNIAFCGIVFLGLSIGSIFLADHAPILFWAINYCIFLCVFVDRYLRKDNMILDKIILILSVYFMIHILFFQLK